MREKPLPREDNDVIEKFRQQLSSLQEDLSKLAQENKFWNFAKLFSPVADESNTTPQRPVSTPVSPNPSLCSPKVRTRRNRRVSLSPFFLTSNEEFWL